MRVLNRMWPFEWKLCHERIGINKVLKLGDGVFSLIGRLQFDILLWESRLGNYTGPLRKRIDARAQVDACRRFSRQAFDSRWPDFRYSDLPNINSPQ